MHWFQKVESLEANKDLTNEDKWLLFKEFKQQEERELNERFKKQFNQILKQDLEIDLKELLEG